jgi:hypothetical protein
MGKRALDRSRDRRRRARFAGVLGLASFLAFAAPASAAPPDARVEAARALGRAGLERYDHGAWPEALDYFQRAYELYPAPTLGLHGARCLDKLGRLVEAAERYERVASTPLDAHADKALHGAVAEARREGAALRSRIPRVVVTVDGPHGGASPRIRIDGKPLERGLGEALPLDPGPHRVELVIAGRTFERTITLREGKTERVIFAFSAPAPATRSSQRAWGWAAVGVGATGVALGGGLAAAAVAVKGSLDGDGCRDGICPADQRGKVDTYNALRIGSTIGLLAGAVGVGSGVVLVVTSDRGKASEVSIEPRWTLGGAALRGRF